MVTDLVQRSWKYRLGLTVIAALAGFGLATGISSLAEADPADLEHYRQTNSEAELSVLSADDRLIYKRIFRSQSQADWNKADDQISLLKNNLLLGHVYYQRFMAPQRRASYQELSDWMKHYADHPGAKTIYKMAMQRKPADAKPPKRPAVIAGRTPLRWLDSPKIYRSNATRDDARLQQVATTRRTLLKMVDRGEPSNALTLLSQPDIDSQLDPVETDQIRQRIAAGYYHWGKTDDAMSLAEQAARRSGPVVPMAHWYAGLARWQKGDIGEAAIHFEAVARSTMVSSWMQSAGGYWAARAYLITLEPERVVEMLEIGASHPRTFYGLLSIRALGADFPFNWSLPALTQQRQDRLLKAAPVRRAIALTKLGMRSTAEQELLLYYNRTNWNRDPDLVALAGALDMPYIMYRIGQGAANYERLAREGRTERFPEGLDPRAYDAALFPMPPIAPNEGYRIDKALIYAFIRQESRFRDGAVSGDGALGLMQIMPATARHVAKRAGLAPHVLDRIEEPSYNLMVGQRYLEELLGSRNYNGDLLRLAAAYNGGPGNLRKWSRRIDFGDDALLFLESLPSRETRMFIERVLTNYWMYRIRMDQNTPSLDTLVAGDWPRYEAQDDQQIKLSRR